MQKSAENNNNNKLKDPLQVCTGFVEANSSVWEVFIFHNLYNLVVIWK